LKRQGPFFGIDDEKSRNCRKRNEIKEISGRVKMGMQRLVNTVSIIYEVRRCWHAFLLIADKKQRSCHSNTSWFSPAMAYLLVDFFSKENKTLTNYGNHFF